jgi:AraC-like DNA-binding protein
MTTPPSPLLDGSLSRDPLAEALHLMRLSGAHYFQSELTAPWGLEMPVLPGCVSFHVIMSGTCLLDVGRRDRRKLAAGDLVLLPMGAGHVLRSDESAPTPPVEELPHDYVNERFAIMRFGGGGALSELFCGALRFGHPAAADLVGLLPDVIHIDSADRPELAWIRSTIRLLAAEARHTQMGSDAITMRLADLIVIQAIRHWLARDVEAPAGWFAALRDEQIARAIAMIHAQPDRSWTVAALAAELGMSRSVFSARFSELVREPAMQYVTRWKMQLAFAHLSEEARSVSEVADQLGYQSEASFSRAFKRIMGFSPGKARRLQHLDNCPLSGPGRQSRLVGTG